MFGRQSDFKKILGKLERQTPEHTSVIGAKFIGKTVFLNAVVKHLESNSSTFTACIYWDISRYTPTDDADFFKKLAGNLSNLIDQIGDQYGEFFKAGTFETLKDVFDDLQENDKRILIVIDNLDKLLQIGQLSRTAWDNLRTLGELSSVCFVTGSRKRLRELIGSPEIQGSPFWNLFGDTPMTLTAFTDEDWAEILAPFGERQIKLEKGACTELENFTGGMPILASAFCINLWENLSDGANATNETVTEMVNGFVAGKQDILKEIWADCADSQGSIEDLANEKIDKSSIDPKELENLENNGIVLKKNGKVCRLMKEFLDYEKPQIKELERLFGSTENFDKNIKKVLQLRLSQVNVDETLLNFLRLAVENIYDPKVFCAQLRNLSKRALELIWKKDLPDGKIPDDWVNGWKQTDRKGNDPERHPPEGIIPAGGRQLYLLNLMTDARKAGESCVSRTTYLMLDYLYGVGDFGAHLDDNNLVEGKNYPVPDEFAYTVCLQAIEMCDLLSRDLSKS